MSLNLHICNVSVRTEAPDPDIFKDAQLYSTSWQSPHSSPYCRRLLPLKLPAKTSGGGRWRFGCAAGSANPSDRE